jgi:hypothetical protein
MSRRFEREERLEDQRWLKDSAEIAQIIAEARRIFELEARAYANIQARLRAEHDEIAHLEMEGRIQAVLERKVA